MSNPSVFVLSSCMAGDCQIKWEDNLAEAIHLHIGTVRLSLTTSEFHAFARQIRKMLPELLQLPGGYRIDQFDPQFLERFSAYWRRITEIERVHIRLADLFACYGSNEKFHAIPLHESPFSVYFQGFQDWALQIDMYTDICQTRKQRLEEIRRSLVQDGYPASICKEHLQPLIVIDDKNRILDGEIRAACLLKQHGSSYEIPVLRFSLVNGIVYSHGRERRTERW